METKVCPVRLPETSSDPSIKDPTVRNVHNWTDFKITMDDFIKKLRETPAYASADGKPKHLQSLHGGPETHFPFRTGTTLRKRR